MIDRFCFHTCYTCNCVTTFFDHFFINCNFYPANLVWNVSDISCNVVSMLHCDCCALLRLSIYFQKSPYVVFSPSHLCYFVISCSWPCKQWIPWPVLYLPFHYSEISVIKNLEYDWHVICQCPYPGFYFVWSWEPNSSQLYLIHWEHSVFW